AYDTSSTVAVLATRLDRLARSRVGDRYVARARDLAHQSLARELRDPERLGELLLARALAGREDDDEWIARRDAIERATPESVRELAASVWGPGVHLLVIGPASQLRAQLIGLGELRVYDASLAERRPLELDPP
ncbi:MAG: hypothetical protein H6713_41650, partial [Myxococcales bacterium]|nr:hypothetical protein [Myxococcales bacterium]